MISLCTSSPTILPLASQTEIVGALATNVIVAQMTIERLWIRETFCAVYPFALVRV